MDKMTDFFAAMLALVAEFLSTDPIIYIFGLVLLIFVVEIFRRLLSP